MFTLRLSLTGAVRRVMAGVTPLVSDRVNRHVNLIAGLA